MSGAARALAALLLALAAGATGAAPGTTNARYGVTADGRPVTAYTLANDRGVTATILDFGATIASVRVPDRHGRFANVMMSFADMAGWESLGHANAVIGRFANRIDGGFTLDGVHYPLHPNAQGMVMHGGATFYGARMWQVRPIRRDRAELTLTLDSPDGDQGFPGHVVVTATYRLGNDNALRLDLAAVTDKATVINLTNHAYFNLAGNGTVPVWDQEMEVATDRAAEMPLGQNVTGRIVTVVGTPFDFTRPTMLKDRLALALGPQYDTAAGAPPVPPGMTRTFNEPYLLHAGDNRLGRVAARLHDPASGRTLEVRTTEISVHVYTPPAVRGGFLAEGGRPFTRVPAIAFETQHLPDSPNRPEFPSTVLRPGQRFRSTTIFAFGVDAEPPSSRP